nr:MAG TPA: hypothetical protein [Caudoviricetes sp.]
MKQFRKESLRYLMDKNYIIAIIGAVLAIIAIILALI